MTIEYSEEIFPQELLARPGEGEKSGQYLNSHCQGVAKSTACFLTESLGGDWASLADLLGWLHDLGKTTVLWQQVMQLIQNGQKDKKPPPHAAYGAKWLMEENLPLLALCVMGHHSGIADRMELPNKINRLDQNQYKKLKSFLDSSSFIQKRLTELRQMFSENNRLSKLNSTEIMLLIRCFLSCLVDADRLNSQEFAEKQKEISWSRPGFRKWEVEFFLKSIQAYRNTHFSSNQDSSVNIVRAKVLQEACEKASLPPGFFALTVPTGGGKTLTSLEFALRHALANPDHGFRRIIVVIPYLSIIEQNSDRIRKALGEQENEPIVLEHHSSIEPKAVEEDQEEDPDETRRRMATENWEAPVIITTSVQFLETLFHNHPTRIRKLHNIARSIVILDEVQTLPRDLIHPTLEMMKAVRNLFGCTVVFATATQPALAYKGLPNEGLGQIQPIIEGAELCQLYESMKRVRYDFSLYWGALNWDSLIQTICQHPKVLCVVNTKRHAQFLAKKIPGALHFSAAMCPHHRAEILDRVKAKLKEGSCILIATQAIECGVDISFPVVFRAIGPMEGIIQAAGRCNREKEESFGKVFVFLPPDDQGAKAPPDRAYRDGIQAVEALLANKRGNQEEVDLDDPSLFNKYSEHLLGNRGEKALDTKDILGNPTSCFRFAEIAQKYQLIENKGQIPVVTPFVREEGESAHAIIEDIRRRADNDPRKAYVDAHEWALLQRYTVSFYPDTFNKIQNKGYIEEIVPGLWILKKTAYDQEDHLGIITPDEMVFLSI